MTAPPFPPPRPVPGRLSGRGPAYTGIVVGLSPEPAAHGWVVHPASPSLHACTCLPGYWVSVNRPINYPHQTERKEAAW